MRVWRLAKQAYTLDLTGQGNRRTGARWNSPGRPVVYTSAVLSLAVLETLVHTRPGLLPKDLAAVEIHIPDHLSVREIPLGDFPSGWETGQRNDWFRQTGDAWLITAVDPCLKAPSVIVPEESNVMLNSLHPAISQVQIVAVRPFRLDPRLVK